jgi:UDP-glucose 4-epimerase
MSAILVTGATAPLGIELSRTLARNGERVLAVGPEPAEEAAPLLAQRGIEYRQADLGRPRELRSLLFGPARDLGVAAVVHTAQEPRSRGSTTLSVDSISTLLHLCERHPTIRAFVHRSSAGVYRVRASDPALIDEEHPLELGESVPPRVRARVEADQAVCARIGVSPLRIAVLRCAECLGPGVEGELRDYLGSRVCFRPLGYDPMLNLLSTADLVRALALAAGARASGIFNVPGLDTLPLSEVVERWGRLAVRVPGFLLAPLYALRAAVLGTGFRYAPFRHRFHFGGVPCGARARAALGYEPREGIFWPSRPWPWPATAWIAAGNRE